MSRHSAPGTDGAYGDETWLPGGSSAGPPDDASRRRRQPARHAADPHYQPDGSAQASLGGDSQTGPPREQPGWDDIGSLPPGPGPVGLAGKHPSEPLPSLPPPPLPEGDWAETPQAFGYDGEAGDRPATTGPATTARPATPTAATPATAPTTPATGTRHTPAPDMTPAATRRRVISRATTTRAPDSRRRTAGSRRSPATSPTPVRAMPHPAYADGPFTMARAGTPTTVTTRPGMSTRGMTSPPPARTSVTTLTARAGTRDTGVAQRLGAGRRQRHPARR